MQVVFNPFTGSLDFAGTPFAVPDPLTVNNLTVNTLLTAAHIHGSVAGSLYIHVKNLDTEPLEKGAPFYISGTVGSSDRVEVKRAKAGDPSRGPAVGLIESTLAVNGEGNGVLIGEIFNYNTETPGWTTNQALYVGTTGTLVTTPPATGYRQVVGCAGRIHASTGTIIVSIKGSDSEIPLASGSAAGRMSSTDKTKLDGIASGATANQTDSYLLNRSNHTGTQPANTITGLSAVATSNSYSDLSNLPNLSVYATLVETGQLRDRLDAFRNGKCVYVSTEGNNANNGTSEGEPLRTLAAAAVAAQPGDLVIVKPGVYVENVLPIRWKRDVGLLCGGLRNTTIKPGSGQEMNGFFKVDSGFWCWGLEFAGHQANSGSGQQSWAISFDELADNQSIGAVGLGAYILKSPYIQNCSSITAEDDAGTAGSQSTGDTGGGILVDGAKCAVNSPIRSMVVDSYTQVNLGGPGCLVVNDGYAQLVSFFGTFCSYHVRSESGGQVNLSGGGTSDFGTYGLMADGYSPTPLFTGGSRIANYGATRIEKSVTIDTATDVFTSATHSLSINDQVTFSASNGSLPPELTVNTPYYVIAANFTANTFQVSTSQGGAAVNMSGTASGTYQFVRQGVTEIDIVDFSANRLGRQIKYPSAGSPGSTGNAVTISARGGTTAGSSFTVTLATSTIKHEYVGGGTATIGGQSFPVTSAVYDNATGITVLTASGYAPVIGASVTLSGLSFICNSVSRPGSGMLMFPQLVFPRNASTGAAEAKTFTYTKLSAYQLQYTEASAAGGPEHEYVSGGSVVIGGTDYGVATATYNKTTGLVTITTKSELPGANGSTGSATVNGLRFICPTSAYVVTSSVPIKADGTTTTNSDPLRAGYRVLFYSSLNGGLKDSLTAGQILDFRNRSQVSAPSHTFEYVGSGTNYDALPWNGGVPVPANKIVETNNGKVYSSNTDEIGNFQVGDQFSIDGTTGSVTINTDQFNLSGLNFVGPFSRNGGISTVGVQLREVSNNTSLLASTGAPDGNTAPTQFAVKEFTGSRYLTGVSATAGQPITITGAAQADGTGNWTFVRNIELSLNAPNGLVRLDGSGLIPAALLPSYVDDALEFANLAAFPVTGETGKIYVALDTNRIYRWGGSAYFEVSPSPGSTDVVPEGSLNLYFTQTRARQSISVTGSLTYDQGTGVLGYSPPASGAGSGTVTSVALSLPSLFTVTGSPVVSSGTLTAVLATQSANVVLAGPATGSAAAPAFRSLVAADLPNTAVTPGSYTNTSITVDATGRLTAAASGLAVTADSLGLGTTATPQFAALGLGTAAVSGWELTVNGGMCQLRQSVTISDSTYTLDVRAANEFVTAAAINGNVTINLLAEGLNAMPNGYLWRGVLSFAYTSGTVTWFGANTGAGYAVKWDGGFPPTLTANEVETVVITVVGGGTTIEVASLLGRA